MAVKVKSFWPVQCHHSVIDAINKQSDEVINVRNKAFLLVTYDFSTHYTNIQHNKPSKTQ